MSGIILVTSCHKHLQTRVKELKVPKSFCSWPIIIAIGDPRLDKEYEWRPDGILVVKCEDSYFHLIKKIYKTLDIIMKLYDGLQGALICGDDVIFNYDKLAEFIKCPKSDYMGWVTHGEGPKKMFNPFMSSYFLEHPQEWNDPLNGIQGLDLSRCVMLPCAPRIAGTIRYASIKTINNVINFLKGIDWNCFHYDNDYGFITICEDLGVGAIMQITCTPLTFYKLVAQNEKDFETGDWVGYTTNKYK